MGESEGESSRFHWLSSPQWAGIRALAAIFAGVITLAGFVFTVVHSGSVQRPARSLEIRRLNESLVLYTSDAFIPELELRYQGRELDNLVQTLISVNYTGQETIQPEEWLAPLKISLTDNAPILFAQVHRTDPGSLRSDLSLTYDSSGIQIEPLLLNPDDSIQILFLRGGGRAAQLEVQTRIEGIHDVNVRDEFASMWSDPSIYFFIFLTALFVMAVSFGFARAFKSFMTTLGYSAGRWTVLTAFLLTFAVGASLVIWMFAETVDMTGVMIDRAYTGALLGLE